MRADSDVVVKVVVVLLVVAGVVAAMVYLNRPGVDGIDSRSVQCVRMRTMNVSFAGDGPWDSSLGDLIQDAEEAGFTFEDGWLVKRNGNRLVVVQAVRIDPASGTAVPAGGSACEGYNFFRY